MERQGRALEEGSGSNPAESVNAQLVIALTKMTEYFEKQEAQIGRLEQPILETADDVTLQRFQKFRPPTFNGEGGVDGAERWIETIEKIYRALKYSDERKVTFGEFQLEGPAKEWWRVIEERRVIEETPHLWSSFVKEFWKKFIPQVVRERKEEKFIGLKQKNLTVDQYEILFTKLSKYAPDMVNTEEKIRRRFLQ